MGKKEKKKFGKKKFFPFPHSMGKRVVECARQKRERSETAKLIPPTLVSFFLATKIRSEGMELLFFSVGEGLLSRLFFLAAHKKRSEGRKGGGRKIGSIGGERKRGKEVLKPQSGRKSGWREWKLSRK